MALIRNGGVQIGRINELARQLVDEIRSPHAQTQPVIYENEIAQTQTYHVTVVWDAWKGMPSEGRTRTILSAYAAIDSAKATAIRIARGLTRSEAASTGLLPYAIVPNLRRVDQLAQEQMLKLLVKEGAFETGDGLQLRFRTLEEAESAYEHLQELMPGAFWSISQEREPAY